MSEKFRWIRNKNTGRLFQMAAHVLARPEEELVEGTFVEGALPVDVTTGSASGALYVRGLAYRVRTAEQYRQVARDYLALAKHVEEHPPVDEGQVKALGSLLEEASRSADGPLERWLVQHGVKVEEG